MPCKHLVPSVTALNMNQIAAFLNAMKGIIQHVLGAPSCLSLYPLSDFRPQNQEEETSCPRIDDSVSNIPKLTNTDQASVTISVPPCDIRHHMLLPQCSRFV